MRCCSKKCKRSSECGNHSSNIHDGKIHQVEDFSSFVGSYSISDDGIEKDIWCGERGNYKMFQPLKLTKEEFVVMHCNSCGSQRCEGIGTEWFDGCRFKEQLKNEQL